MKNFYQNSEENKKILLERLIFLLSLRCCLNEEGKEGEYVRRDMFEPSEIDNSIIELTDMYIKAVIGKSRITQYRKFEKHKKSGLVFYRLDGFEEELIYEDSSFENMLCHRFYVGDQEFYIRDDNLAQALLLLTDTQRDILFQTEVAERSQREVAKDYGFSFQMVSKHRQNALRKLREALKDDKKE